MKTLSAIMLLVLLPVLAQAQISIATVNVNPVLNPTQYDSIIVRSAWDTLRCTVRVIKFDSATVTGQSVFGTGIPWGTTVTYIDTAQLKMSKKALASDSVETIQIGKYTSAAYASGDCMGFPFVITDSARSNAPYRELSGLTVIDESKQAAAFDVFLFDTTLAAGTDSAAWNPDSTLMAKHCLGSVSVAASDYVSTSSQSVASVTSLGLLLPKGGIYGQCVSRGTPTYLSKRSLRLKFMFKVAQ